MTGPAADAVVVGGGAAGALTAVDLCRREARVQVVLVEPSAEPGRGAAYSTSNPRHLLNVPARGMSGVADEPDHFLRWVEARDGTVDPDAYLPRALFGDYVVDLLASCGDRVHHVRDDVTQVQRLGDGTSRVTVASGNEFTCRAVVLALGSPLGPPGWAWPELQRSPRYVGEPWNSKAVDVAIRDANAVLIVGMGLTMADLTLTVTENGSRVVAVSRSGELSRTHALSAPAPPLPAPGVPPGPLDADELREFVCRVMASAEESGAGWRAGIDSLRPVSNALWQRVPLDQQRRVLERDLRAWEVRRHRLAPVTSESLVGLAEHGVLRMHRGTVAAAEATPEGFEVMIDDGSGGALHGGRSGDHRLHGPVSLCRASSSNARRRHGGHRSGADPPAGLGPRR